MSKKCPKIYDPAGYFCGPRRKLRLRRGKINDQKVKLQCAAFESLQRVELELNRRGIRWRFTSGSISTYRTCRQQRDACNSICGRGCDGCPGLCAPCGIGKHIRGLAIDACAINGRDADVFRRVLLDHGWNDVDLPNDPCHWSYRTVG